MFNKLYSKETAIAVVLAILFSFALVVNNVYVGAIILGIVLFIVVLLDAKTAFWIMMINIYLIGSLVEVYYPFIGRRIIWVTDISLFALLVKFVVNISNIKKSLITTENILLLFFFGIGIFSAYINSEPVLITIGGMRNYFKYIPLYLYFRYFVNKEGFVINVMKYLFIIAVLNVPISIIQYKYYHNVDSIGGLFCSYGSGILAIYQVFIIGYLLARLKNRIGNAIITILLCMFLLIPIFLNETKISFIILPLTIVYIYRDILFKRPIEAIIIFMIFLCILIGIGAAYSGYVKDFTLQQIFSKEYYYDYLYKGSYFGASYALNRGSAIEFAFKYITKDIIALISGVGPGNASFSNIRDVMGELYRKYEYLKIDFIYLSKIMLEYGILGTAVFFSIVFTLYKRSLYLYEKHSSVFVRTISQSFGLLCIVLTITTVYDYSFSHNQFGCLFWMLAGFISQKASGT